jgi:choline dehydrogenase-like flavoprotein
VFGTVVPTEQNCVRPHPTLVDEFGQPKLEVSLTYSDAEMKNVNVAIERFMEVLDAAGLPCRFPPPTALRPDVPGSSVHFGGTVRLHDSPSYGMLDRYNRLHAVPNVLVVDASAFTTGVEKNPTLTAMALAARAAEQLSSDLERAS